MAFLIRTEAGGRLGDEAEASIREDGDDHGDHQAHLLLGPLIEGVAELHDVQTMLTEGRPHRRGGIGLPGLDLQLDLRHDFLGHADSSPSNECRSRQRSPEVRGESRPARHHRPSRDPIYELRNR